MCSEVLGLVTFVTAFMSMVLMYRFFGKQGLIAWVAVGTIIVNIQVIKTVEIFGISTTLGNVMLASVYLAADVLNDIYGCRIARRAVWLDFPSTLITVIVMQLSLHFALAPESMAQKALHAVFDVVPHMALGPVIAYITGQHTDVFIFSLTRKVFSSDKTFFIRAYGSTFLSSITDTVISVAIAFIGSLSGTVVLEVPVTTYVLKLASTVFNVPFGYIAKSLYHKGKIDKLDRGY